MENFLYYWKRAIFNLLFLIIGFTISVATVVGLMLLTITHPLLGGVTDFLFLTLAIAALNTYIMH